MQLPPTTKEVAALYALWIAFCAVLAACGYGDSVAAQIHLVLTGLPLSLLSLHLTPSGTVLATITAGALGLLQWSFLIEAVSRWESRKHSRNP